MGKWHLPEEIPQENQDILVLLKNLEVITGTYDSARGWHGRFPINETNSIVQPILEKYIECWTEFSFPEKVMKRLPKQEEKK